MNIVDVTGKMAPKESERPWPRKRTPTATPTIERISSDFRSFLVSLTAS